MGARLNGIQKVAGSNPAASTCKGRLSEMTAPFALSNNRCARRGLTSTTEVTRILPPSRPPAIYAMLSRWVASS